MTSYIRKHTIFPEEFPEPWASDWGEDEFGLWMAFTYKGVRQAFRWCEPGAFMMGAPPDEPERFDNELQHQVTLTKGFWIADTTVTQALWEVIAGENPSKFKGEDRPVENVSWKDAQAFVAKMNGLKAELKLCLPTEAQWEYACRAANTTPFCWGDQIDSTLVNFDGSYPYNNGSPSQDRYGDYPAEPVIDPQRPESGDSRVLRGGSARGGGGGKRGMDCGYCQRLRGL